MTREEFEKALSESWKDYCDCGAATVDIFDDDTQELAYAKGFYAAMQMCGEINF